MHYNDLKADLDGEMRRIARFLEMLIEAATFASMKRDNASSDPKWA